MATFLGRLDEHASSPGAPVVSNEQTILIFRSGGQACALPIRWVEETMRPLPAKALDGAPEFVVGVVTLRGEPVPVVNPARLLSGRAEPSARRFISVRAGDRRVALAVADVIGVRDIEDVVLSPLPPLLTGAAAEHVDAVTTLDGELLLVLRAGWVLPQGAWSVALEGSR